MERQKENGHSGVLVSFLNWVKYFLFGYFYIVAVDYGMKPRENTPFYCMLLFLFMVLSFWGKQKIRRLLPFLFYQAVVVCGCTFIGRDSEERVLFFLFATLQFGIAFASVQGEKKCVVLNSTPAIILIGIPGLLYAYVEKYTLLYEVFLWITVLFLWIHVWNIHIANRQRFFVEYAQNADSMEKGKMLADGNGVIGSLLGVAAIGLLLGTQIGEGRWLDRVLQLLYQGLRWFLELLTHGEVEYVPEAVKTPMPTAEEIVDGEIIKQNELLSIIMEVLFAIIMFTLKVLSVLAVLAFLALFVYTIWKSFYKKQPEVEIEYEEVEKIREKLPAKVKRKREFVLFGNANIKVRKLFQRKIEKTEKDGQHFKRTKTSTELVEVVSEDAKHTVEQMLPLYQKARYSKKKISKEELESYKKL